MKTNENKNKNIGEVANCGSHQTKDVAAVCAWKGDAALGEVTSLLARYPHQNWIIVGKSCSGKDWLAGLFEQAGCIRVVDYTTRPLREGEIGSPSKKSVSVELFKKLERSGAFCAVHSIGSTWYGLEAYGEEGYVMVVDEGSAGDLDGVIVKCEADWETRVERKMKRDGVGREEAEKVLRERDWVEDEWQIEVKFEG